MNKVKQIELKHRAQNISGAVSLTGSKSISNRLLIMRALAGSHIRFDNLSTSSDTQSLKFYLKFIEDCASSAIPMVIDSVNAGTFFRFLTAYLSIKEGTWLLTGCERMKERPVESLISALKGLGAQITSPGKKGFPPLRIIGSDIKGGHVAVDPSVSSQFVTALMLIAPYLEKGLHIQLVKKAVSFSYIEMTKKLMQEFGIHVKVLKNEISIEPGEYKIKPFRIEADWSASSYWYEIVALSENAEVFLEGFSNEPIQGDRVVAQIFEQLGVSSHFETNGLRLRSKPDFTPSFSYDFSSCPDLVPAVLASCAGKGIHASVSGIAHLRFKESDRIAALQAELKKIGATLISKNNSAELIPSKEKLAQLDCVFDTHNDHRMALALAPLAVSLHSVKINKPEVVNKSYPLFWDDLKKLGMRCEESKTDNV